MVESLKIKKLVFAPIAQREVDFYLAVAKELQKQDSSLKVEFISFYQNGNAIITKNGYKVWDLYSIKHNSNLETTGETDLESEYGIPNIHKFCLHEKLTFKIKGYFQLYKKFENYLKAIDLVFHELLKTTPPNEIIVFQELGGFIAPMALFFVSRKHKIEHVFFEPSFFRGKLHFLRNTYFLSFGETSKIKNPPIEGAISYLETVRKNRELVIPEKDRHHYKDMGLSKLFNGRNIRKLLNKLYIKFFLRQKQEYEHIFSQVSSAVIQYVNRKSLGKYYVDVIPDTPFVYFPFHVALDFQLTVRDPNYLDQLSFVRFLCGVLPKGLKLVVKEHPASIGGMDAKRLADLLKHCDNLILLSPMINTYNILEKTCGVITISSKVGAEAIVLEKPVACVGHGFYFNSELVTQILEPSKIEEWLNNIKRGEAFCPPKNKVDLYFSEIFRGALSSELYNLNPENLDKFTQSVNFYLGSLNTNP